MTWAAGAASEECVMGNLDMADPPVPNGMLITDAKVTPLPAAAPAHPPAHPPPYPTRTPTTLPHLHLPHPTPPAHSPPQ